MFSKVCLSQSFVSYRTFYFPTYVPSPFQTSLPFLAYGLMGWTHPLCLLGVGPFPFYEVYCLPQLQVCFAPKMHSISTVSWCSMRLNALWYSCFFSSFLSFTLNGFNLNTWNVGCAMKVVGKNKYTNPDGFYAWSYKVLHIWEWNELPRLRAS